MLNDVVITPLESVYDPSLYDRKTGEDEEDDDEEEEIVQPKEELDNEAVIA